MNLARLQDTKIITQKSIVLLNTCNEQSKNETETTIPFIIASKWIKYLKIKV